MEDGPPFTLQRLCELVIDEVTYPTAAKYVFACLRVPFGQNV
jgi:hypothetical protein